MEGIPVGAQRLRVTRAALANNLKPPTLHFYPPDLMSGVAVDANRSYRIPSLDCLPVNAVGIHPENSGMAATAGLGDVGLVYGRLRV